MTERPKNWKRFLKFLKFQSVYCFCKEHSVEDIYIQATKHGYQITDYRITAGTDMENRFQTKFAHLQVTCIVMHLCASSIFPIQSSLDLQGLIRN